jgi:hypothetical protein
VISLVLPPNGPSVLRGAKDSLRQKKQAVTKSVQRVIALSGGGLLHEKIHGHIAEPLLPIWCQTNAANYGFALPDDSSASEIQNALNFEGSILHTPTFIKHSRFGYSIQS